MRIDRSSDSVLKFFKTGANDAKSWVSLIDIFQARFIIKSLLNES